jgi:hypothetical protein
MERGDCKSLAYAKLPAPGCHSVAPVVLAKVCPALRGASEWTFNPP